MIPSDPYMLLSYLNTQLRDNYSSLQDLSDSLDIDIEEITEKLASAGYQYDGENNRFVKK